MTREEEVAIFEGEQRNCSKKPTSTPSPSPRKKTPRFLRFSTKRASLSIRNVVNTRRESGISLEYKDAHISVRIPKTLPVFRAGVGLR
jgi:hypothetical protein